LFGTDTHISLMMGLEFETLDMGCLNTSLELTVLCAFALGYFSFRRYPSSRHCATPKELEHGAYTEIENSSMSLVVAMIEDEITMGHYEAAVHMWRNTKDFVPTPTETLRLVLKALHLSNSDNIVEEITGHMSFHRCHLSDPAVAAALLETASKECDLSLTERLLNRFEQQLGIQRTPQICEPMIFAYATANAGDRLSEFIEHTYSMGQKVTLRGYALALKGLLANRNLDSALLQASNIVSQGYLVPPFAVASVYRVAREINRLEEVLDKAQEFGLTPSLDVISDLIQYCELQEDSLMAQRIEALASSANVQLCSTSYCGLLQIYVSAGDHHAFEVFDTMQQSGFSLQASFYNKLLERSAASHFESFSAMIQEHLARST